LTNATEPVKVVQERLGHSSAVETLDTYSHLWPDDEDGTRAAVDEVLGAARIRSRRTTPTGRRRIGDDRPPYRALSVHHDR
jgi:hypothetical protein